MRGNAQRADQPCAARAPGIAHCLLALLAIAPGTLSASLAEEAEQVAATPELVQPGRPPGLAPDLEAQRAAAEAHATAGEFRQATKSYQKLRRDISKRYGGDDVRLVEPLSALADIIMLQAVTSNQGRPAVATRLRGRDPFSGQSCNMTADCGSSIVTRDLDIENAIRQSMGTINKAIRIARVHATERPTLLAMTLIRKGDLLTYLERSRDARKSYREAWHILDKNPALHATRDQRFDAPKLVTLAPMRPFAEPLDATATRPTDDPQPGYADVLFDVDERGKPRNIEIQSARPAELVEPDFERRFRRLRFRPAFSDGKPLRSTGLVYRRTFRYDQAEMSESELDSAAAAADDQNASSPASAGDAATGRGRSD